VADLRERPPFGYDIRAGAAVYAVILGSVGGFVVPSIVLLFTQIPDTPRARSLLPLAVGLLAVALIACLLGAFGLAAIGAERQLTANLAASGFFAGAGAAVGILAMLASFEVLAAIYLPSARSLFITVVAAACLASTMFVAFSGGDAWLAETTESEDPEWRATQWLATQERADWWAMRLTAGAWAIIGIAGAARLIGLSLALGTTGVHLFVGGALLLTTSAGIASVLRTHHPAHGKHTGTKDVEAFAAVGLVAVYCALLIECLP
jgi:hypothetical protein